MFTGEFTQNADIIFPSLKIKQTIQDLAGKDQTEFIDATRMANALTGDSIATNIFLLGFAFQKGFIPLQNSSIEKAIEINGISAKENKLAFMWGRRTAFDRNQVRSLISSVVFDFNPVPEKNLDKTIQHRADILKNYQNEKYGQRYLQMVERIRSIENDRVPGSTELTKTVAIYYYKLLAYKDEYEVARLYANGDFLKKLNGFFEGDFKLKFHLAPPLFSRRDFHTGELKKSTFGMWLLIAMKFLSRLKFLRGTIFDPFGKTRDRKMERQLIKDYELTLEKLLRGLSKKNHDVAIEIAKIPEMIRGYDLVKNRNVKSAKSQEKELLDDFLKLTRRSEKHEKAEILG